MKRNENLSFTYNCSDFIQFIPTVCGSHYPRTLLRIARLGTICVHTSNCDSVNAANVTVIRTTVSYHATISSGKGVNGTQATTTLINKEKNSEYMSNNRRKDPMLSLKRKSCFVGLTPKVSH